jgi:hypothetical protein
MFESCHPDLQQNTGVRAMQQISVESSLGQQLGEVSSQVVVCDSSGRVLGLFLPILDRPRVEDLQLEPPLSIDETEQLRQKSRTGKPLEEILGRLGL